MGGLNVLDNIVVFYIFFTIVGFLAAMIGTIIGAGGGLVFVPLFMYWFPEWSIIRELNNPPKSFK